MAEDLPIPLEIPWKLVATTQELKAGDAPPEVTTISLFIYEPQLERLQHDYPDERLVYLKFTVSVSPLFSEPLFGNTARTYLEGGLPVWHVMLDLKVTPNPAAFGGIRPYFHAAAPMHRTMLQSGVVGHEIYEGTSDALSIGKSASQLHETMSSKTKTKNSQSGGSAPLLIPAPIPIPATVSSASSTTTTTVDSERNVDQFVETTTRDASQERRELLSHTTNVENIFTLLNLKHVGSPYLRFCLWPRPLIPLSVSPNEPSLWYSQLLQRRSSGIEGIQEFVAVLMAPKEKGFCLEARLRRMGVLDIPPIPPDYDALRDAIITPADRADIDEYLHRLYPTGTSTDEIDVDLALGKELMRAAVIMWNVEPEVVRLLGRAIGPETQALGAASGQMFFRMYKTNIELRLDLLRAKYEEELTESPLERGVVLLSTKVLNTCFTVGADGTLKAQPPSSPQSHFRIYDPAPKARPVPARSISAAAGRGASRHVQVVAKWNALFDKLAAEMTSLEPAEERTIPASHPKVVQILLQQWESLPVASPKNYPLDQAATLLGFSRRQAQLLSEAGATDLRGIARAINAVPRIERLNGRVRDALTRLSRSPATPSEGGLQLAQFPISENEGLALREAIGRALVPEADRTGA